MCSDAETYINVIPTDMTPQLWLIRLEQYALRMQ